MLIDTQIIGIANTNSKPTKQMPNPTADKGKSIAQHKQGRNGKASRLFNKLRHRQIQMNNPIPKQSIHPSIATTPRVPAPIRHPTRQMAPNNIEVKQIHANPNRIMKMRRHIRSIIHSDIPHINILFSSPCLISPFDFSLCRSKDQITHQPYS